MAADMERPKTLALIVVSRGGTRRNSIDNDNRLHVAVYKKIKHLTVSDVVKQNDSSGTKGIE